MKCRKHTRVTRIEGEETRQHIETVMRARTEEKRMDMAVGSSHRETVAVSSSRVTFTQ